MTVSIEVDEQQGGRITSLRTNGLEWLWTRSAPERFSVQRGDPFVDAGGIEECFPTIAGNHGLVWSGPFPGSVEVEGATFERVLAVHGDVITLDYAVMAQPGLRFVWAFHALVEPAAELRVRPDRVRRLAHWPNGYADSPAMHDWPWDMDAPGVLDGTARFAALQGETGLTLSRGASSLRFELRCSQAPISFGLWNNRGGFDSGSGERYQSFGVEPMLGRNPDLASATDDEVATVPASGRLSWSLTIRAGLED